MREILSVRYVALKRQAMVRLLAGTLPLIVVNEYPRSGGTWLGKMLAELWGAEFSRNRAPRIRSSVMHGHYLHPSGIRNAVLMWRDGRDVMVSLYHHCYFENELHNAALVALMKKELPFADYDTVADNLPAFMERILSKPLRPRFTWPAFVRSWHSRNAVHVRYENLLKNTAGEVGRVAEELGIFRATDDAVRKVVEEHSFARATGRARGSNAKGNFARKGIAGDWKNYFNFASREIFARHAGDELIALGYERNYAWVSQEVRADDPTKPPSVMPD